MADGSIRFTAEIDDKDAQKALAKLERDISKTQSAIQKTSSTRDGIAESLRQAQKEAVAAYNEVERLEKALAASKALTANNGKSKPGMASSINADEYNAELEKQQLQKMHKLSTNSVAITLQNFIHKQLLMKLSSNTVDQ